MKGYRLTDRGKIVVTILIVFIFLFLPAAILIFSARAEPPANPPANQNSSDTLSPPSINEPPLSGEAGINSVQPPPSASTNSTPEPSLSAPLTQSPAPPEQGGSSAGNSVQPPDLSPSAFNPDEGTLSFFFSTSSADKLDDNTAFLLDDFLSLPKNTPDSTIAVETPHISPEYFQEFSSMIVSALTDRGIPQQRIAFITRSETAQSAPGSDNLTFEVNLSYIIHSRK